MANIIASGTAEVSSADFTLAATDVATLFLVGAAGSNPVAILEIKGADASYNPIGRLTIDNPCKVLSAPGTYRVTRKASTAAFGVDKS